MAVDISDSAPLKRNVSVPVPALMLAPGLKTIASLPAPVLMVSLPPPPSTTSLLPTVSLARSVLITLAALLPTTVSLPLPVLTFSMPDKVSVPNKPAVSDAVPVDKFTVTPLVTSTILPDVFNICVMSNTSMPSPPEMVSLPAPLIRVSAEDVPSSALPTFTSSATSTVTVPDL